MLGDTYPQCPAALETHGSPFQCFQNCTRTKKGEGVLTQTPSLTPSCPLYKCPLRMTSFNVQPSLFQRVCFAPPSDLKDSSLPFAFFTFLPPSPPLLLHSAQAGKPSSRSLSGFEESYFSPILSDPCEGRLQSLLQSEWDASGPRVKTNHLTWGWES